MQIVGGYDFKNNHLEFAWLNDQIKVTHYGNWNFSLSVSTVDIDGDGQEEMRFLDEETGKPVILKGEREFSK